MILSIVKKELRANLNIPSQFYQVYRLLWQNTRSYIFDTYDSILVSVVKKIGDTEFSEKSQIEIESFKGEICRRCCRQRITSVSGK